MEENLKAGIITCEFSQYPKEKAKLLKSIPENAKITEEIKSMFYQQVRLPAGLISRSAHDSANTQMVLMIIYAIVYEIPQMKVVK